MVRAFAALLLFYRGHYNGVYFALRDDPKILSFFKDAWTKKSLQSTVETLLGPKAFWGCDLTTVGTLLENILEELSHWLDKEAT